MKTYLRVPQLRRKFPFMVHSEKELISQHLIHHHHCEPVETALMLGLFRPEETFIDVGANMGYYAVLAGQRLKQFNWFKQPGEVYAFEPGPDNIALLKQNVALNQLKNITVVEAGCADYTGEGQLFLSEENQGDNRIYHSDDHEPDAAIKILKLDDYFNANKTIHYLKIDTQGSDFQVLKGAMGLIEKNHAHLIITLECWPYGLAKTSSDLQLLATLIDRYDLALWGICENYSSMVACSPFQGKAGIQPLSFAQFSTIMQSFDPLDPVPCMDILLISKNHPRYPDLSKLAKVIAKT